MLTRELIEDLMLNDPILFIFWSPRLTIFGVLFDFVPFRALAFHQKLSGDRSELETKKALLCFLSPFLHVFCEITGARQTFHILANPNFALYFSLHRMWRLPFCCYRWKVREVLGCLAYPFFSLFSKHQQQVAQAVERAKQVTMAELNAIIGVRGLPGLPPTVCITSFHFLLIWWLNLCIYKIFV